MGEFVTAYTEALEAEAKLANPSRYKEGEDLAAEMIREPRGEFVDLLKDTKALSRYIIMKRAMVSSEAFDGLGLSSAAAYAVNQRPFVYGLMSELEAHINPQLRMEKAA